eukprot:TRINITY_DN112299_c0_g1_i1.p1 TRINITY_DN112299_c0_g1~~TRINITY_DN112299_c0_g1_i1.p1  ORF type:complete len:463 (-),score=128.57 TRINITY_DN112299_c0_g1_i1:252-1640(-)
MDDLTDEQREKLLLFREVTAETRSVEAAKQLLRSCDWNTERALELHWATGDEVPASTAGGSRSAPAPAMGGGSLGQGPMATPLLPREPPTGVERRPTGLAALPYWLMSGIRAFGASLIGLLRTFLFGTVGAGGILGNGGNTSGPAFRRSIVNAYGQQCNIPQFFEGGFSEALSEARRQTKLLVVYLHSEHARYTQSFCTQILANEFVRSVLDENFVVWGGDTGRRESHQIAQMIHARQYPYFCVLLPAQGEEIRVIGALQGDAQVDGAIALLTSCLEEMDSHRAEIVALREQQAEDRSLRAAQDQEYQEALEADRKREEQKQAAAKAAAEAAAKEAEEQREREAAEAEAERQRQDILTKRKRMAEEMGAESSEATARISLRLPAGQRVQRKFRPTDTLQEVYTWAASCAFLPENSGRGIDVPLRFELKQSFPSQELKEMDKTVQELQLAGSNILLVQIEDDD